MRLSLGVARRLHMPHVYWYFVRWCAGGYTCTCVLLVSCRLMCRWLHILHVYYWCVTGWCAGGYTYCMYIIGVSQVDAQVATHTACVLLMCHGLMHRWLHILHVYYWCVTGWYAGSYTYCMCIIDVSRVDTQVATHSACVLLVCHGLMCRWLHILHVYYWCVTGWCAGGYTYCMCIIGVSQVDAQVATHTACVLLVCHRLICRWLHILHVYYWCFVGWCTGGYTYCMCIIDVSQADAQVATHTACVLLMCHRLMCRWLHILHVYYWCVTGWCTGGYTYCMCIIVVSQVDVQVATHTACVLLMCHGLMCRWLHILHVYYWCVTGWCAGGYTYFMCIIDVS